MYRKTWIGMLCRLGSARTYADPRGMEIGSAPGTPNASLDGLQCRQNKVDLVSSDPCPSRGVVLEGPERSESSALRCRIR